MKIKSGTIAVVLFWLSLLTIFSGTMWLIWGEDIKVALTLIVTAVFLLIIATILND